MRKTGEHYCMGIWYKRVDPECIIYDTPASDGLVVLQAYQLKLRQMYTLTFPLYVSSYNSQLTSQIMNCPPSNLVFVQDMNSACESSNSV